MKKYVFDFMFDKKSTGDQRVFDTEAEAIAEKDYYYSHLTESEKKDLLYCSVYEAEVTPEQAEEIEECGISGELADKIKVREIWSI